jgi:predicted transglutaminase-like cysteine proteinase
VIDKLVGMQTSVLPLHTMTTFSPRHLFQIASGIVFLAAAFATGALAGGLDSADYQADDYKNSQAKLAAERETAAYRGYLNRSRSGDKTLKILDSEDLVPAPPGWDDFCNEWPDQCVAKKGDATVAVEMSEKAWHDLLAVNQLVNQSIWPTTDVDHWGVPEKWSIPDPSDMRGDCEDYALLKRKMLMDAGWPAAALLMTVLRDAKNEGHAVLTVKTDLGDFVLDNERSAVLAWHDTGYRFIKIQSADNPNVWVPFDDEYKPLGLFRIALAQKGSRVRGAKVFE